jgi:hypothetical protein
MLFLPCWIGVGAWLSYQWPWIGMLIAYLSPQALNPKVDIKAIKTISSIIGGGIGFLFGLWLFTRLFGQ